MLIPPETAGGEGGGGIRNIEQETGPGPPHNSPYPLGQTKPLILLYSTVTAKSIFLI
jgi:hypothetical protein